MLRYFAIKVGDVATAAQMVGVIVELHLFVVIVGLKVAICSSCAYPCLCRLRRAVIAAESLTIYIVVIVLTVIWDVKRLVVVLDGLQLLTIFCLIVYGYTISLIACVWYSSWVCLLYLPL